ncbi:hypothetical protein [Herbiconiux sp. YIM B11900]|uniref:hypothetical protein n=1 Tax=Herbiconiux sp. YIM B11900 TaxID=3404131 RepID=UPI003F83A2F1
MVATIAGGLFAPPAQAAETSAGVSDLTDPVALIGALAPELLAETSPPATPEQVAGIRTQQGIDPFQARIPADPGSEIRLSPAGTDGAGLPVGVTIDYARGRSREVGGITAYPAAAASGAEAGGAAAYVQPIQNGIRMLTALADRGAGEDFSYTFDLPQGSRTTALPDGDTLVSDAAGHYVGTLGQAWARDASGAELPTDYRWAGTVLTQHVELGAGTVFPVLLDPVWFYSYDFSVTIPGYHANHPTATAGAADRLLHGCFNCWFPINGAPRGYPVDGQVLTLNASPFTIITVPAPVKMQTANGGAMQFVAQPGHFDGAGSIITFSWYNDPSGFLHLYVHAKILVDRGPAVNIANSRLAGANWLLFWQRVADHADGTAGGGGV